MERFQSSGNQPIVPVLAGPTAVGKTEISLLIAENLGGEIISSDSRQIYRGLDIGTAKPSNTELDRVQHHLIDELDVQDPYSAGIFLRLAGERIQSVIERGRIPIVTGGSTLYLSALIHGMADIPHIDPDVRSQLNARLDQEGAAALYQELLACDPAFSATLDETKSQRIVRGLEVYMGTGKPLSSFFETTQKPPFQTRLVVLNRERANLYERINRRVDDMMESGFLAEVKSLLGATSGLHIDVLRTIGYKEIISHLNGLTSLEEAIRLMKRNTRRYAKRQLTWYRRFEDASWIDLDLERDPVQAITALIRAD